ncbi:MAG: peptidylprolyl isomerase [Rhodoferax sp.]
MNSASTCGACAQPSQPGPACAAPSVKPVARINGIALHAPGVQPDAATLRELAHTELLRQQAVQGGLLLAQAGSDAVVLSEAERQTIETMLELLVVAPQPSAQECARYYAAHQEQFVVGQALHLRHILFAVTPGVDVTALAARAEQVLLSLLGPDVPSQRFAQQAAELSNCPTGAQGGDLGWIGPKDCAPELARELFAQKVGHWPLGVQHRMVHTRFGFHIIDILAQRQGEQKGYEAVRARIAAQLSMQSRAVALHQFMRRLIDQAQIEGLDLQGADSPLLQ